MSFTAREMLDRLVAFPTVSRESNLDLVDFVEGYLRDLGVESVRVPNGDGTKAALYAHVGPPVAGGVVLSGHTDVVPVDGQAWDTDPFTVTEREGRLYGRGTCDMKGFDALALAAVPLALEAGIARPLQIALSYDEEIGCLGAPPMIEHMAAHGMPRADTVIVGEPTSMQVVTGNKGIVAYDIHVRGFEVHSSMLHEGVSAIHEGARLIGWINDTNAALAARPPSGIAALYDPPFTTVHTGVIAGGTADNITARDCTFTIGFRLVPDETIPEWEARLRARVGEVEAAMKAIHPDAGITMTETFAIPGLVPEPGSRAEELARRLTGDNGTRVVSYGTEAGQFRERGYSAVICGPGDIAQAHQPNEFITLDQFRRGGAFMRDLVRALAA